MADDLNSIIDIIQSENVSRKVHRPTKPQVQPETDIPSEPEPVPVVNNTVKVQEAESDTLSLIDKVDRMKRISTQIKKSKKKPPSKKIVELW